MDFEEQRKKFEGYRSFVYLDTTGHKTIGYGHNLQSIGSKSKFAKLGLCWQSVVNGDKCITKKNAEDLYQLDRLDAYRGAKKIIYNFDLHPKIVQDILIDLVFNLGFSRFSKFKRTISSFLVQDYKGAAIGLKNSLWAKQVKSRACFIINLLKSV